MPKNTKPMPGRRPLRSFLLALGFLTRLAPALKADAADMALAVLFYPLAGIVLGAVLVLPFLLGAASGFGAQQPLLQAWLYTLLSLWLTRALHLDGLADVLDALGSARHGPEFRKVLNDSRIGVFGAAGLCMALSGQIVFSYLLFQQQSLLPLFAAPVLARCLPIILARIAQPAPEASLGALLQNAPQNTALAVALICAAATALLCLPLPALAAVPLLFTLCLLFLQKIARREGGYNGDFFGFLITTAELIVLAASAG